MKVLYIFCDFTSSEGVFKKVYGKIKYLNENNIDTLGMFFRSDYDCDFVDNKRGVNYYKIEKGTESLFLQRRYIRDCVKPYLMGYRAHKNLFKKINKEVDKQQFDLILFRYPSSSFHLRKFVKKHIGKVIFESNANEMYVLERFAKESQSPEAKYAYLNEKYFNKSVMRNAKGVVSVGLEVEEYQKIKTDNSILTTTIANGLDLDLMPVRIPPFIVNNELNFLFLTGSPRFVDGMDLILNGLKKYQGTYQIKLTITGPIDQGTKDLITTLNLHENVQFTGILNGDELNQVFNRCHFAIGTMALHRKGLKEHSALKVCEYIGRGIPFVLSYTDTNLVNEKKFEKFYHTLPSGEDYLNFEEAIQGLMPVLLDHNHPQEMRSLAIRKIDYKIKMKELSKFLYVCYEK
jgi:hypothetical protein